MELTGRVAVVTGGAAGIGRALCRRFARQGAQVVVSDVDAPGAARVAFEIDGLAVAADVSVEADVVGLVETVLTTQGRIDLHGIGGAFRLERQIVPPPGEAPELATQNGRLP